MYTYKKFFISIFTLFLFFLSPQVSAKCIMHNLTGHCIIFDDKSVIEHIETGTEYLGRCGVYGEGYLYVRNKTSTEKIFKLKGVISGSYEISINPGKGVKKIFCNRDMVGVEIYSSQSCGKTYLGKSKTVRAYKKEIIDLKPSGFRFHVHDVLDPIQRISGLTLTIIAESYGIEPEVLAAIGVREAEIISSCRNANIDCLYKIYNYLPQELKLKVNNDSCLKATYNEGKKRSAVYKPQHGNGRIVEEPISEGKEYINPDSYEYQGIEDPI